MRPSRGKASPQAFVKVPNEAKGVPACFVSVRPATVAEASSEGWRLCLRPNNGLIKKNEKLKAKLASSQDTTENLLEKMEILSIHNNELTTKLENIGSTPGASLVEIPEIIKKDASTSCFDLIDDSNSCNQVLVENIVVETCSDEVANENEQLRQEVARLGKALYDKKGKAKQI
jgi:hypothetical protein